MRRDDSMNVYDVIERTDERLGSSSVADALEDIAFDDDAPDKRYEGTDGEEVTPEFEDNDQSRAIEAELETYDTPEKMESMLVQEGLSVDDPVRMYLKEIGQIPLLSAERERELAKMISEGELCHETLAALNPILPERLTAAFSKYKSRVPRINEERVFPTLLDSYGIRELIQSEDEMALAEIFVRGEVAKEMLTQANLRLVVSIAKRHVGKGMYFLDLIQEGNAGLMKAVEKFDYNKGYKFSTYATWWIRQAITRAIADQARTIRIPVHMVETIHKVTRASRLLLQELGREPTIAEIAASIELTPEKVREIMKIAQDPVSLETPIGEEEDSHLGDFVEDTESPAPDEQAVSNLLKEQLAAVLRTLTPREEQVLILRYGLNGEKPRTLEEVGRIFNITRERIRQIEAKALRKLRHPSRSKPLQDFLT